MPAPTEGELRSILTGVNGDLVSIRKTMKRIPSSPRCKLCAAPFGGAGGSVLKHLGFGRFPGNPAMCNRCIYGFRKSGVSGAEIPVTLLFADIRGSTGIGERLPPREFHVFLDAFYRMASDVLLGHDGLVDKFVGDEVIGLFFGGVSGPAHQAAAIDAGLDLLARAGKADASSIGAIPLGAAVHTGDAYVGATGPVGVVDDFTALGDVVNTTARLAGSAADGELLVSIAAADAAGRRTPDAEQREVEIRGRLETIDVVVLRPGTPVAAG
jgi:adenylate cyclase